MSRPIFKYIKVTLVALSPVKLSSGVEQMSDADVLVDASGKAFIPGTTLAGVMRHYVQAAQTRVGKDATTYVNQWFGYIEPNKNEESESLLRVYDAFPCGEPTVSMRDGVRLTDNKTASPQGKFDYQVVDAGATFELRMRLDCKNKSNEEADELIACIMQGFMSDEIMVGGKTSRGFGKFSVADVKTLSLDLSNPGDVKRYVDFDWDASAFEGVTLGDARPVLYDPAEVVNLELVSPLLIRVYATVARSGHENKLVDAETLKNSAGKPVIPGTSWAGAFRHHMRWILESCAYDVSNERNDTTVKFLNRVFGEVSGSRGVASKIEFCETTVDGSKDVNYTRTAIDRFTGGAADQMLFTNRISYGGTTVLRIRWRSDLEESDKRLLMSLVRTCVNDLYDGTLAVGGMTATGCGVFCKDDTKKVEVTA